MVSILIFYVNLFLYILVQMYIFLSCIVSEEIERREKALMEELNLIEVQIGLGKHLQNFEASSSLHTVEAPRLIEEGEENRDPNPEHDIEPAINDNADISMQSIINENFDNDHTMEEKEEIQSNQIQPEVNNG